ncbi:unnamed protein product, partial [Amoebophrya sp. A120]|eukprot:GSA120T00007725001.1
MILYHRENPFFSTLPCFEPEPYTIKIISKLYNHQSFANLVAAGLFFKRVCFCVCYFKVFLTV